MTKALDCVAENAKRLLADAESLFELGKWQSATALAILALEEAGKHFLIRWERGKQNETVSHKVKQVVSHKSKQAVLGSFYVADAALEATIKILNSKGIRIRNESELEAWRAHILKTERGVEFYNWFFSRENEELRTAMATSIMEHKFVHLGAKAMKGEIDKVKQKALYVDVGADGEVVSNPSFITREIAEEWIAHARFAIGTLESKD
ncbi:MAG: AbiV family abortive infection protein [Candidatus Aenigmarchaeota archaeon]|nr:AbiV family abortive infection protein [Candidatus Aenigmarchaeota archaeon]